jgi:hypothetical protein
MVIKKIRDKILKFILLNKKYPTHIRLNPYQYEEIKAYIKEDKFTIYNLNIVIGKGRIYVYNED